MNLVNEGSEAVAIEHASLQSTGPGAICPKSRDSRHTLDRATHSMVVLALAALIVGAASAIDGNLSQLPP
jgi:hypothetical protein